MAFGLTRQAQARSKVTHRGERPSTTPAPAVSVVVAFALLKSDIGPTFGAFREAFEGRNATVVRRGSGVPAPAKMSPTNVNTEMQMGEPATVRGAARKAWESTRRPSKADAYIAAAEADLENLGEQYSSACRNLAAEREKGQQFAEAAKDVSEAMTIDARLWMGREAPALRDAILKLIGLVQDAKAAA